MKSVLEKKIFVTVALAAVLIAAQPGVGAQAPWPFLHGFKLIPNSPARIEDRYIAALFINQEKQQMAMVIFNVTCDWRNCEVNHPAAYSIYDKEGRKTSTYVNPGDDHVVRRLIGRKLEV